MKEAITTTGYYDPTGYTKLFDVTAVIGSVYSGGDGTLSPRATAFVIIADHGAPGTFTFPDADAMVTVTVEYEKPL